LYIKTYRKEKSVEKQRGTRGGDAWWRLAGAGGQDGSFDSPGQGEPYNVGITYLIPI